MDDAKPTTVFGWFNQLWNSVLFPAEPDRNTRVRLWSLALVFVLPAVLLYPCRSFYLLEPDEGRYAQIPKEMHDNNAWVVPTLQGEPYLDKPPLMYWLVSISYKLFGVSEASARLVPALAVHLTILMIYLIGRRSIGERGAFWAAMILSVAPGFLAVARLLLLDGLLTICITTSMLCGFEAVRTGKFKRGWWIAAAVMSGLGFLTKGPISEILLFPPLFVFAYLRSPLAGTNRGIRWKDVLLFAGIVVGINLPWYIAIYLHQPMFLKYFFWEHNILRFVKPFDHLEPVWYFVPIFLMGFLPGLLIMVSYLRSAYRGTPNERSWAGGFWLLAGLWCLAFFSFSGSKLPTYILPAFPPLCLALGEYVARSKWNNRTATRGIIAGCAAFLAVAHYAFIPWYAKERSPMNNAELVSKYVNDPNARIVTYPRHIGSVAFYTGRTDLERVRMKPEEMNAMIRESHFRQKTVILFTQSSGLEGFRETLRTARGSNVEITDAVDLQRKGKSLKDKLLGFGPWGLCEIAVLQHPGGPIPRPNESAKK